MPSIHRNPKKEIDGWSLVSAEERHASSPITFQIPSKKERGSLQIGDGAKLLFDIETRMEGIIVDRGVDRMWVIVKSLAEDGYLGILDNNPGIAENLRLCEGDIILFGPEHVIDIETPPREYIVKKYGSSFFIT